MEWKIAADRKEVVVVDVKYLCEETWNDYFELDFNNNHHHNCTQCKETQKQKKKKNMKWLFWVVIYTKLSSDLESFDWVELLMKL